MEGVLYLGGSRRVLLSFSLPFSLILLNPDWNRKRIVLDREVNHKRNSVLGGLGFTTLDSTSTAPLPVSPYISSIRRCPFFPASWTVVLWLYLGMGGRLINSTTLPASL